MSENAYERMTERVQANIERLEVASDNIRQCAIQGQLSPQLETALRAIAGEIAMLRVKLDEIEKFRNMPQPVYPQSPVDMPTISIPGDE